MVAKTRKPTKAKTIQPRATQSATGTGPATATRSKDAKPTFGKAAPRKVVAGAKVAAKTAKPRKPATGGGSMTGGAIRTAAAVAAGAVVAVARGAASAIGRGGTKAKAK